MIQVVLDKYILSFLQDNNKDHIKDADEQENLYAQEFISWQMVESMKKKRSTKKFIDLFCKKES